MPRNKPKEPTAESAERTTRRMTREPEERVEPEDRAAAPGMATAEAIAELPDVSGGKTVIVCMMSGMAGANFSFKAGDLVKCTGDQAERLFDGNIARKPSKQEKAAAMAVNDHWQRPFGAQA